MLHFAATGQAPFGFGEATTTYQRATAYQRIVHEEPNLSAVPDPALRALIADCMAKSPAARPTVGQVSQRLSHAATETDEQGRPSAFEAALAVPLAPPPPANPAPLATVMPPAPPLYSPPQPGTGTRGRRRGLAILAGVLSMALIVAVAVLAFSGSNSSSQDGVPDVGESDFTWTLPLSGGADIFVGLWSTPSSAVLGTRSGLTAYDIATGEKLWSWTPPDAGILCNMSYNASDGTGAFVYGTYDPTERCDRLQTISVSSGDLGWTEAVSLVGEGATGYPDLDGGASLSIGDGVVSAPYVGARTTREYGSTDLLSVDVQSGRVNWSTDFGEAAMPSGCRLSGGAQVLRDTVYAIADCDGNAARELLAFGDGTTPTVSRLGTLTGCNTHWEYEAMFHGLITANADHLLAGCDRGLYALSAGLNELIRVNLDGVHPGGIADMDPRSHGFVHNDVLMGGPEGAHQAVLVGLWDLIAVDLNTGEHLWTSPLDGSVAPMALSESGIHALVELAGHPSLYTVDWTGHATEWPALNAEQVAVFTDNPVRAVRAGDYLAVGFIHALDEGETLLGVLPTGD